MKPVTGYHLIGPDDLKWRLSDMMKIPNPDFLERTGSKNLSARLWRSAAGEREHAAQPPPRRGILLRARRRARPSPTPASPFRLLPDPTHPIGGETLTVPKHGGVLVGPEQLRQVFNDTDAETLWLIVGAPEELEFLQGSKSPMDLSLIYPQDPTRLPPELAGVEWPPASERT
jgi:hypothetical protein